MEPTICYNCEFFLSLDPNSEWPAVWYNRVCAAPLPLVFNYVTGELEPQECPDYRKSKKKYPPCRDINTDGKCARFERKT